MARTVHRRKPPRVKRQRASIWDVLADPAAHPERNRRLGDNLFLAFAVFWVLEFGSVMINRLMP